MCYTNSSIYIIESKSAKKRVKLSKLSIFVESHDLHICIHYFLVQCLWVKHYNMEQKAIFLLRLSH